MNGTLSFCCRRQAVTGLLISLALGRSPAAAAEPAPTDPRVRATAEIRQYLRRRVERLSATEPAAIVATLDQWQALRPRLRAELFDMLGLAPLPERSSLQAVVTGQVEQDGIVVEKLHFQSLPKLYVTANFYRPREVDRRLPAVLYLNGHARAVENGVSLGNKTPYQHHGAWLARHGYCCLTIDTLQLGEIEGVHHGTYRLGMGWWTARGYTPAGVEAWNALRALDYLAERPEVDAQRIGVTGRSGGGAYTWWVAALDDRPACIAPVAGITDLENHVVDNCIEGHCDCMFQVNAAGWDFATLAALAAPCPCLLANTDKDPIFPLSGVTRLHAKLRRIYELHGAGEKLGLFICEGPHADTQELQLAVFRWFNRWLKDETGPVQATGEKPFPPAALKVFDTLPTDQRNTTAHEWFVPLGQPPVPQTLAAWETQRRALLKDVAHQSFRGITSAGPLDAQWIAAETHEGQRLRVLEFTAEENLRVRALVLDSAVEGPVTSMVLEVVDDEGWSRWLAERGRPFSKTLEAQNIRPPLPTKRAPLAAPAQGELHVVVSPRGWGSQAWETDAKTQTHLPRRFVLTGTTVDEGRIWDVRRTVQALGELLSAEAPLILQGEGPAAGIALYAGVFEPSVTRLQLRRLPATHRQGPLLMGVLKTLDVPQTAALFLPRPLVLADVTAADWEWTRAVAALYDPAPLQITPSAQTP